MVCVAVNNIVFFWCLFLVSSFPFSTHANVNRMAHGYDGKAIFRTFQIDGEVYDCVDIYKQPGMKHPLLVNHTIQMEPTRYPGMSQHLETNEAEGKSSVGVARPWSLPESCPKGSVPMRRVQGHNSSDIDLHIHRHRHYFLKQNGTNNYSDQKNYDRTQHEHCIILINGNGERYLGARAYISLCAPRIAKGSEFSLAQLWVHSMDLQISLEAGWTVYPGMYDDHKTRFFTMWTTDGYNTYCYNNKCPGYIHTNPHIPPDTYFTPISFVGGPQYSIKVELFQDASTTKHWWVSLQSNIMGYWPRDLVPSFEWGAESVQFGGEVLNKNTNGHHTATEMGMGTFASEGPRRAAFFKNVEVVPTGSPNVIYQPPPGDPVIGNEFPSCYNIQLGNPLTYDWGYHFFFGGPGWSSVCP